MNKIKSIKKTEARRLRDRCKKENIFTEVWVVKNGLLYNVRFKMAGITYEYPISFEQTRGTEEERNEDFDKFVCECILHASKMIAVKKAMLKDVTIVDKGDIK